MTIQRHAIPRKPRAILFDMDGVIVDSMPYHFISWYEALRPYDVSVKCFDVYQREGEQWDKALRALWRPSRRPLTRALIQTYLKQKILYLENISSERFFMRSKRYCPICDGRDIRLRWLPGRRTKKCCAFFRRH